jgi:hypothetical protein
VEKTCTIMKAETLVELLKSYDYFTAASAVSVR